MKKIFIPFIAFAIALSSCSKKLDLRPTDDIDATKAFQGGKTVNATVNGTAKTVQTSNLTPDATGLMSWNVSQIATAITAGKDKNGATICGMRALANMSSSDAIDIGTYLLGIPAVANAITMTCQ